MPNFAALLLIGFVSC